MKTACQGRRTRPRGTNMVRHTGLVKVPVGDPVTGKRVFTAVQTHREMEVLGLPAQVFLPQGAGKGS